MSDWAIWAALIVAVPVGIGALALFATRALQAWRTLKDVRRHAVGLLGDLVEKGETTAEKVAAAGDTAEVQESVARLRVSLAKVAVLQAALAEAEESAGWVTALL